MDIISKLQSGSAEETLNSESNSELIRRTDIEDTPFTIVTTTEGSFGTMGPWRLTHVYKDEEQCKRDLVAVTWNRIVQVIGLITEKYINVKIEEKDKIKINNKNKR